MALIIFHTKYILKGLQLNKCLNFSLFLQKVLKIGSVLNYMLIYAFCWQIWQPPIGPQKTTYGNTSYIRFTIKVVCQLAETIQ